MREKENQNDSEETFPFVPIIIMVMLFVSAYFTYIRAYESGTVRYFLDEEEVENFDPMISIYGNN